jgi:monooxygenase
MLDHEGMTTDHVDVLIVGAGLSGIGAACHLQRECPGKTYAILESREASGGTWDLFRYPGIRSDSDMFTLGYSFEPWTDAKAIADGPSILSYIRETAQRRGVDRHIRYSRRVVRAEWSSADSRWTVHVRRTDSGETEQLTCGFLFSCTGYYRYDQGYTPEFPGLDRFGGQVIHPQHWPEDLDYTGKRVVVIGSGATAVTLVPSLAERAAHVTMLQRSPSYVVSLPSNDAIADVLRRRLPTKLAYSLVRWKNVLMTTFFYQLSRKAPRIAKGLIRRGVAKEMTEGYAIDTHFKPKYNPWDQRVCLVPDGDLFQVLRSGQASIVTDEVDTFTETGVGLKSGVELEADIVISATGLNMLAIGGMQLAVDGDDIRLPDALLYKGMMLSDVPNFAVTLGYTNASWTLKCDLTCEYICRLLNHMDAGGFATCTPRNGDGTLVTAPAIDLMSGYVLRSIEQFPQQGHRVPWRMHQNYPRDIAMIRRGSLEDEAMEFAVAMPAPAVGEPATVAS